mmetsp:Transcript_97145/g.270310  ORF Transcript_97145/g.270310 Transcript_97145/m.270310 type:complete len:403 (-) Transcript_97145:1439-2647(-)
MQAEAHLHSVLGQALQQARVIAVDCKHPGLVYLSHDLDEGHDGHVRKFRLLLWRNPRQPPDDEEGVTDVLVGGPVEVVNATMHDLTNLVDEDHDLLLQDLGGEREVADVAKADDGVHLVPGHHRVNPGAVPALHVLPDDLGAGFSEAQGQQATQLDDGLLEDDSLHGLPHLLQVAAQVHQLLELGHLGQLLLALGILDLLAPVLQVAQLYRLQRIVLDGLHLSNHALDGVQEQLVCVGIKGCRADANGKADEDRLDHAQACLQPRDVSNVEGGHDVEVPLLISCLHERHEVFNLRAPQLLINGAVFRVLDDASHRHPHTQEIRAPLYPRLHQLAPNFVVECHHRAIPVRVAVLAVPRNQLVLWQYVAAQKPGLVELHQLAEIGACIVPLLFVQRSGVESQPE